MAIDVSSIHNLVRTYQRALQDQDAHHDARAERPRPAAAAESDRLSLSEEARRRLTQTTVRGTKA